MTFPRIKGSGPALDAEDHDWNMLFLSGFPSLAAMLADTARDYSFYEPDQVIEVLAEGYRYRVAASDATDHHLTTAAGMKLYVVPGDDGVYNFRAFNPAANGTTDDYAKLMLALGVAETGEAPNKVGPTIFFPRGVYRFNSTVQLRNKVTLLGAVETAGGTAFVFGPGVSGFVVNAFNTSGGKAISEEDATTAELSGAAGSVFKGIYFSSGGLTSVPSVRANVDGIWLRAPAKIVDCSVRGWPGAGIRIEAWAPADKPSNPELWGDASGWYLENVLGSWCGKSPLRVRGTRASAGTCTIGNFAENGWWGFDDHATGTNFYLGCHTATNGLGTSGANVATNRRSGVVSYGGNLYRALPIFGEDGDPDSDHLQDLVDTIPGTDPAVWQYWKAGGVNTSRPLWVPGQAAGTYFPSGGYKFSNSACGHVNLGGYSEDDEAGCYYNGENVFVVGGIQNNSHKGRTMTGVNGLISMGAGTKFDNGDMVVTIAENDTTRRGITVQREEDIWNLFNLDAAGDVQFGIEGAPSSLIVTGPTPAYTFGTSGANDVRDYMAHVSTIAIGNGDDGRRHTRLAAAPTTGKWALGDIVWNRDPTAGGFAAWICTTAGTPGTWKACLPITV